MDYKLAVVGAGVIGLTTAVQLQQAFSSASVTIIADKFMESTTSIGAAGIYSPSPVVPQGVPYDIRTLLTDSWNYFHELAHSKDAGDAGCHMISGYEFYTTEKDIAFRRKTFYSISKVGEKEMNIFPVNRSSVGYRCTTILTSPVRFLPYLTKQFISKGGQFEKRKLVTLEELVGRYNVVVNCTGFGARELIGDSKLYSSRGQIIRVVAPWIKTYMYTEDDHGNTTYIFPTSDFVIVGGSRQSHDEFLKPRDTDRYTIWQQATEMVPSLKKAQIIGDWVGLRPMRDALRLESEVLNYKSGSLKVVHNYGHGGGGIGLSWGSAKHAVSLVKRMLNEKQQVTSKL